MPSAEPGSIALSKTASGGLAGPPLVIPISPALRGVNWRAAACRAASYGLAFVSGIATMFALQPLIASRQPSGKTSSAAIERARVDADAQPISVKRPRPEKLVPQAPRETAEPPAALASADSSASLRVAGILEPAAGHFAKLSLATNQAIAFIDVKPGDRVEKGWQVFSHWESPDRLQASQTELAKTKVLLSVAQEQADAAQRTAVRLKKLGASISAQELQDAETAASIRRHEFEALQLAVSESESRFAALQFEFNQAFVTTPIDGLVATVDIALGERRQAGGPFRGVTIVDPSVLQCRCLLEQRQVAHWKRFAATVESEGREWAAKVVSLGAVADPASGLTPLLVEIENPEEALRSGARVTVILSPEINDASATSSP